MDGTKLFCHCIGNLFLREQNVQQSQWNYLLVIGLGTIGHWIGNSLVIELGTLWSLDWELLGIVLGTLWSLDWELLGIGLGTLWSLD